MAASASEAVGRSERISHEKDSKERELRTVKAELISTKAEMTRCVLVMMLCDSVLLLLYTHYFITNHYLLSTLPPPLPPLSLLPLPPLDSVMKSYLNVNHQETSPQVN